MIKDIELIIGRKIRGLKYTDQINMYIAEETLKHVHLLKNTWSLENNQLTVKNGNFTASFEFTSDNIIMIAKRWQKAKCTPLSEQKQNIKPVQTIKLVKKVRKPIKRQLQPQKNNFNWSAYICM